MVIPPGTARCNYYEVQTAQDFVLKRELRDSFEKIGETSDRNF